MKITTGLTGAYLKYKKLITVATLTCLLTHFAGCGVLLYPERQGQKSGQIDVQVALLNGIGLVFFVVPGLVAFAIDFHQGTIYLPNGRKHFSDHSCVTQTTSTSTVASNDSCFIGDDNLSLIQFVRPVQFDGAINAQTIEQVIFDELGLPVDLAAQNAQAQMISVSQLNVLSNMALLDADLLVD